MSANPLSVFYESTPNPNSLKFRVDHQIANESVFFEDPAKAARSPLAQKLFGFPWAQAVFIGPDFVTVTKQSWVEWNVLAEPLSNLIAEHIERNEGVLLAAETLKADPNDSPIVQQIKHILDTEIRPAVAMDGGDIVFNRYEDHRLYLHMQGACSGCPSSAMTLKDGIESRIKAAIPDLVEVISV